MSEWRKTMIVNYVSAYMHTLCNAIDKSIKIILLSIYVTNLVKYIHLCIYKYVSIFYV